MKWMSNYTRGKRNGLKRNYRKDKAEQRKMKVIKQSVAIVVLVARYSETSALRYACHSCAITCEDAKSHTSPSSQMDLSSSVAIWKLRKPFACKLRSSLADCPAINAQKKNSSVPQTAYKSSDGKSAGSRWKQSCQSWSYQPVANISSVVRRNPGRWQRVSRFVRSLVWPNRLFLLTTFLQ